MIARLPMIETLCDIYRAYKSGLLAIKLGDGSYALIYNDATIWMTRSFIKVLKFYSLFGYCIRIRTDPLEVDNYHTIIYNAGKN